MMNKEEEESFVKIFKSIELMHILQRTRRKRHYGPFQAS